MATMLAARQTSCLQLQLVQRVGLQGRLTNSSPSQGQILLVDATDWSIIPAENLVAACQGRAFQLMMYADSAAAVETLLGALETGVDGTVLRTDDVAEVGYSCHLMLRCITARFKPLHFGRLDARPARAARTFVICCAAG